MPMVSGYVVVELFPRPFDLIIFGRVGWQEVEVDSPTHCFEGLKGVARFMNDVIVEDDMDVLRPSVGAAKNVEHIGEKRGVLLGAMAVKDATGAHIQCPGDVVLDVFARPKNKRLMAALDVSQSDAWIEIDIRFINVEHFFAWTGPSGQLFNVIKDFSPSSDGDAQRRTRSAPTTAFLSEHTPNMAHTQRYARIDKQLARKQFQRPCTALPAVVLGYAIQILQQLFDNIGSRLEGNTSFTPIEQSLFSRILEMIYRAVDRGTYTPCQFGHRVNRQLLVKQQNNPAPQGFKLVARRMHQLTDSTSLRLGQGYEYLRHEEPPELNMIVSSQPF